MKRPMEIPSPDLELVYNRLPSLPVSDLKKVIERSHLLLRALNGKYIAQDDRLPLPKDDWLRDGLYVGHGQAGRRERVDCEICPLTPKPGMASQIPAKAGKELR
jgi:hypothetical protein